MFQEQSFDQSVLIKLTEEPSQIKKVRRTEKVLAGKEGASIFQELYLPLRVIYF